MRLVIILILSVMCPSCALFAAPTPATTAEKEKAAEYGIELDKCIADANTRAEADKCKAGVMCKYQRGPCQ